MAVGNASTQAEWKKNGTRGHTRFFPHQSYDPKGPLQNKTDTMKHAHSALKKQVWPKEEKGLKGPRWLMFLKDFDIKLEWALITCMKFF